MMEDKTFFTKERREANMQLVIEQLNNVKELDFNSLVFAFADIIQSSFLNGLLMGKSKEEREEINAKIINMNNAVIDTLNENSENMMHDMIVLSNLMMDAVENAMQQAMEDSQNV
jgi:hypothetical protein